MNGKNEEFCISMLNRIGHIITFLCLTGILLINSSPREFIHTFSGHTDTIHHSCTHNDYGGMAFESEHHHCAFLDQVIVPYTFSIAHFQLNAAQTFQFPAVSQMVCRVCPAFIPTDSRGPPQV